MAFKSLSNGAFSALAPIRDLYLTNFTPNNITPVPFGATTINSQRHTPTPRAGMASSGESHSPHEMKRILTFLASALALGIAATAQMAEPVHFSTRMEKGDKPGEAYIIFDGRIDAGWHVYSTDLGDDGPISASLLVNELSGAELKGKLIGKGNEIKKHDKMFGMELRFFEKAVTFVQRIELTGGEYRVDVSLEYGACDDQSCLPPTRVDFASSGSAPTPAQETEAEARGAAKPDTIAAPAKGATIADSVLTSGTWAPVVDQMKAKGEELTSAGQMPLWQILLQGLLGGLIAIFTPCVWPIIPLTVSFFLKRNKDRKKALGEALTYGAAIVVIYLTLGLVVTGIWGASELNALATNAIFNIFFCLLLLVFAASFLGAFEITLPSSWADKVESRKGNATGLVAIFLMAFTLALVSFSCTGPIIGFLLVAVASEGSFMAPAVGMLGFALALAIPFTLFALFPSLLKSAPRSGGWMNVVKVTLGFVELAFALKFLSVADMAYGWHILDREAFLSLWIAIFGLLAAYMFGWLKFAHDDENRSIGVSRFFAGLASLAFAIYMVPGLWGAPLKAISAFAPPMTTQDFRLGQTAVEPKYKDYDDALAAARDAGKPLLLDFTGHGCVNCRKMEAAVWTDPTVASLINDKFILVSLYVDDKTPLAEPITVSENGKDVTLRTIGDKWSFLQRHKFGANTQPFYIVVGHDGAALSPSRSYDEDVKAYADFLNAAIE